MKKTFSNPYLVQIIVAIIWLSTYSAMSDGSGKSYALFDAAIAGIITSFIIARIGGFNLEGASTMPFAIGILLELIFGGVYFQDGGTHVAAITTAIFIGSVGVTAFLNTITIQKYTRLSLLVLYIPAIIIPVVAYFIIDGVINS